LDATVTMKPATVPEPTTFLLFAAGAVGFIAKVRRRATQRGMCSLICATRVSRSSRVSA
jgi:hypothetical protein